MTELLKNFSVSEIIICFLAVVFAFKQFVELYDWAKSRVAKIFNKSYILRKNSIEFNDELNKHQEEIKRLKEEDKKLHKEVDNISKKLDMLLISDQRSIKSFITKEHHYCMEKGSIDDYSLDCLEKRYEIYKKENGNSFILHLMEEIRNLPRD